MGPVGVIIPRALPLMTMASAKLSLLSGVLSWGLLDWISTFSGEQNCKLGLSSLASLDPDHPLHAHMTQEYVQTGQLNRTPSLPSTRALGIQLLQSLGNIAQPPAAAQLLAHSLSMVSERLLK